MAEHSLYHKRRLCYTNLSDYTDFLGIGKDPLYKRFDSVFSVVKNLIDSKYHHFFAQPIYSTNDDQIEWYTDNWIEEPTLFNDLSDQQKEKYAKIKERTTSHYFSALKSANTEDLLILSLALKYLTDDSLFCFDDKVVIVAWGMTPDTNNHKIIGAIIHDSPYDKKHEVNFDAGEYGALSSKLYRKMSRLHNFELTSKDIPEVIPNDNYEFTGWVPEPIGYVVTSDIIFKASYINKEEFISSESDVDIKDKTIPMQEEFTTQQAEKCIVHFVSDGGGMLNGNLYLEIEKGKVLSITDIPSTNPKEGKSFIGWYPSIHQVIYEDTTFTATFQDIDKDKIFTSNFATRRLNNNKEHNCYFLAGEHGELDGEKVLLKKDGEFILKDEVPNIKSNKGYKFSGWDTNPTKDAIHENRTFKALYKEHLPWYTKLFSSFNGKGCLKFLLWFLAILLFMLLLSYFLKSCNSREDIIDNHTNESYAQPIDSANGEYQGGNNNKISNDGTFPDNSPSVIAPIVGIDGSTPPILDRPGDSRIIANRLNLYFEDEDVDLQLFAKDFKKIYSGEKYKVIAYDEKVKWIQILVPEIERDKIREEINSKLPNYIFFVVDESIFDGVGSISQKESIENRGWHLKAVNAENAWKITRGSDSIIVAIVDDGLDISHPMFVNKITKPYNVFYQNNLITNGEGHGTHVAGLAIGSSEFLSNGASGIAPNCKVMPVQVFDHKSSSFSSVVNGIMYALHEGADVINISLGIELTGLSSLPLAQQKELARNKFKNEEKVWKKIATLAKNKNSIIVFAAGNDKILASVPPEHRTNSTINVAAIDINFNIAPFSNFGEGSNISAPGVDIYSAYPVKEFKSFGGTSMAAPIVAGAIALMKSVDRTLNVDQILSILQATGAPTKSSQLSPSILVDQALNKITNANLKNDNSNRIDYSDIKNKIKDYQTKIEELEHLLPANEK